MPNRTSCRAPLANQVRLVLHTAAYWLMLTICGVIPKTHVLAVAEFATLRLRLAFAACCPDSTLFTAVARGLQPAGP